MILNEHMNVKYGENFKVNFYLNDRRITRNEYVLNTINVNCWDVDGKNKVFNVEHNYFNTFYDTMVNGKSFSNMEYRTKTNNLNTRNTILFYVIFDSIPFQIYDDTGIIYDGQVEDSFVDEIIKQVKMVHSKYKYANISVVSNVLNYRTKLGEANDVFVKKFKDLNEGRITYDPTFDIRNVDDTIFCVYTNNISFLFEYCHSRNVPVVLSCCEKNFKLYDDYILNKFSSMDQTEFKMFSNDEFMVYPIEYDNKMFQVNEAYVANSKRIEEMITKESEKRPFQKVFFYGDAVIIKPLFDTNANRGLITHITRMEDVDDDTLIITLNKKVPYSMILRKSHDKLFNWLGFDFNVIDEDSNENTMRYYMQSFGNIKPMYHFDTIDQWKSKFNMFDLKQITPKQDGVILFCLDFPIGINYASLNRWFDNWNNLINVLKTKFDNKIVMKTYFDDDRRKMKTKEIFNKLFNGDDRVEYDDSAKTFVDRLQQDDIYFCVKCQGALFLKCFLNGNILLTGLQKEERESKPDKNIFMNIERSVEEVVSGLVSIDDIQKDYNANYLNIIKSATANITTFDDIKNGSFVRNIILN